MVKHIHATMTPQNRSTPYNVDIFQCAYDEICIGLQNRLYHSGSFIQFDIPIKTAIGFAIKVNTASVGNNSGSAAALIDFLETDTGRAFIRGMVQKLIFDHPRKSKTLGL